MVQHMDVVRIYFAEVIGKTRYDIWADTPITDKLVLEFGRAVDVETEIYDGGELPEDGMTPETRYEKLKEWSKKGDLIAIQVL